MDALPENALTTCVEPYVQAVKNSREVALLWPEAAGKKLQVTEASLRMSASVAIYATRNLSFANKAGQ